VLAKNLLIQSATLDGTPLNDPLITWEQIQSAATLKFTRGPTPSRWASDWRPPIPRSSATSSHVP
jgi:putative alpha-1,2-mannosidase